MNAKCLFLASQLLFIFSFSWASDPIQIDSDKGGSSSLPVCGGSVEVSGTREVIKLRGLKNCDKLRVAVAGFPYTEMKKDSGGVYNFDIPIDQKNATSNIGIYIMLSDDAKPNALIESIQVKAFSKIERSRSELALLEKQTIMGSTSLLKLSRGISFADYPYIGVYKESFKHRLNPGTPKEIFMEVVQEPCAAYQKSGVKLYQLSQKLVRHQKQLREIYQLQQSVAGPQNVENKVIENPPTNASPWSAWLSKLRRKETDASPAQVSRPENAALINKQVHALSTEAEITLSPFLDYGLHKRDNIFVDLDGSTWSSSMLSEKGALSHLGLRILAVEGLRQEVPLAGPDKKSSPGFVYTYEHAILQQVFDISGRACQLEIGEKKFVGILESLKDEMK